MDRLLDTIFMALTTVSAISYAKTKEIWLLQMGILCILCAIYFKLNGLEEIYRKKMK